ncbi:MAG: AAA family ATPase, partial [Actinobacteria bacterium]|nr:AAA family ATPase [Actinomycetota bacterium]
MTQSAQSPHIALIGLMGTGKSTVGRRLAKRINYGFFDTDDELQLSTSRSVRDIFANDGEEIFRDLEAQTLSDAYARVDPLVIAVAGGGVLRQSNRLLISH